MLTLLLLAPLYLTARALGGPAAPSPDAPAPAPRPTITVRCPTCRGGELRLVRPRCWTCGGCGRIVRPG